LKESCQLGIKSRWQIVRFILGGAGVFSDWEYGNCDASDWLCKHHIFPRPQSVSPEFDSAFSKMSNF
jgi:hypothetical protein